MLQVDIVKDDSGSHAEFAEQGSSASQMTAAKVMAVISSLPDCAGQAADAVSAYTQVKMTAAPNWFKFQSQNIQIFGHVFHDTSGPNHGQTLKIIWFFVNEICMATHLQASCGKDNPRKFFWHWDGKKYPMGNVFLFTDSKACANRKRGRHQNGWKKPEFESHVKEIDEAGRSWRNNFTS